MWKCLCHRNSFWIMSVCEFKRPEIILWQEVFKALLFFLFDRKCFLFWILWKVSFRLTESHTTVKCLKLECYTLMWSLQERRKLMVSLSHRWRKSPKNCYFSFFLPAFNHQASSLWAEIWFHIFVTVVISSLPDTTYSEVTISKTQRSTTESPGKYGAVMTDFLDCIVISCVI